MVRHLWLTGGSLESRKLVMVWSVMYGKLRSFAGAPPRQVPSSNVGLYILVDVILCDWSLRAFERMTNSLV